MAAYIFHLFTLSKGIDGALSFLGYFFLPNSHFVFYYHHRRMHIRHRRDYDEQKAVVVV